MLVAGRLGEVHPPAPAAAPRAVLHEGPRAAAGRHVAQRATLVHRVRLDGEPDVVCAHAEVQAARSCPARGLQALAAARRAPDPDPGSGEHEDEGHEHDEECVEACAAPRRSVRRLVCGAAAPRPPRGHQDGLRLRRRVLRQLQRLAPRLRRLGQNRKGNVPTQLVEAERHPRDVEPHEDEADGRLLEDEEAKRVGFRRHSAAPHRTLRHDARVTVQHADGEAQDEELAHEGDARVDAQVAGERAARAARVRHQQRRARDAGECADLPDAESKDREQGQSQRRCYRNNEYEPTQRCHEASDEEEHDVGATACPRFHEAFECQRFGVHVALRCSRVLQLVGFAVRRCVALAPNGGRRHLRAQHHRRRGAVLLDVVETHCHITQLHINLSLPHVSGRPRRDVEVDPPGREDEVEQERGSHSPQDEAAGERDMPE
mmetsp:Transcript_36569/g.103110  ORF Transcript_36569/g.103110 Transcript_36569/m.103110 type:complete len:432 (-) Transcript_36569:389-1684(-)